MTIQQGISTHHQYQPAFLFSENRRGKPSSVHLAAFSQTHKERMQRWHHRLERLFARQAY